MASYSSVARLSTAPDSLTCTSGPPSCSFVTSAPSARFTSGGPPANIEPCSVMTTKWPTMASAPTAPADAPDML